MYTIYGYNDLCIEFEIQFDSFVKAVKVFKELYRKNVIVFLIRTNDFNSCFYLYDYL